MRTVLYWETSGFGRADSFGLSSLTNSGESYSAHVPFLIRPARLLWTRPGIPPESDQSATLPGLGQSRDNLTRLSLNLELALLITVPSYPWPYPGVIPPTLVPEADAVLQTRLECHNSFKQLFVLVNFSLDRKSVV